MMKRALVSAAALCCLALAAGCAPSGETAHDSGDGQATQQRPQNPASDAGGGSSGEQTFRFGETYEGAVDTTVAKAEPLEFTTSQYAQPASAQAWAVEFEFTNHTDQTFQPMLFNVSASVDGTASQEVMDSENGFEGLVAAPPVAPGDKITVPVAFSGQGDRYKVRVASMDESNAAVFTDAS